jgi:hypothetical protein
VLSRRETGEDFSLASITIERLPSHHSRPDKGSPDSYQQLSFTTRGVYGAPSPRPMCLKLKLVLRPSILSSPFETHCRIVPEWHLFLSCSWTRISPHAASRTALQT